MGPREYALISIVCLLASAASIQWDVLLNLPSAVHDLMMAGELSRQALHEKARGDELMQDASRAVATASPTTALTVLPRVTRDMVQAHRHYSRALELAEASLAHLERGLRLVGATQDPEVRRALGLMKRGLAKYRRALREFKRGIEAAQSGDFGAAMRHVNASYRVMKGAERELNSGRSILESKTLFFMG